jgi:hypothetical protein
MTKGVDGPLPCLRVAYSLDVEVGYRRRHIMSDPRETLTEETPESPEDFKKRQLTEVGGTVQADPKPRVLTEELPEEEDEDPETLLG